MKQPIATFCSLALCLWAYQTGLWSIAIPMIILLEGREFIRWRWEISPTVLRLLHILAIIIWPLTVVCPPYGVPSFHGDYPSSSPDYAAYTIYFLMRGLPIAGFPLVLAQTYGLNVGSIYHNLFRLQPRTESHFNLYYPYFGLCLLSASSTGGNSIAFLGVTLGLVTGVLWVTRSHRFTAAIFYQLILLAMILSLVGTQQFYWLKANVQPPSLSGLGAFIANIRLWRNNKISQRPTETIDLEKSIPDTPNFEAPKIPTQDVSKDQQTQTSGHQRLDAVESNITSNPGPHSTSNSPQSQNHASGDRKPDPSSASGNFVYSNEAILGQTEAASIVTQNTAGERANPLENSTRDRPSPQTNSLPQGIQQAGGLVDPKTSQTRMGTLGSLQQSNAILFRVTPLNTAELPHPLRIREATYNQYQSGSWNAVQPRFRSLTKTGYQRWTLESQTGALKVQISEVLNAQKGLLKVPVGASEVSELEVKKLKESQYGAIAFERTTVKAPLSYAVEFNPVQLLDSRPTRQDRVVPKAEQKAINQVLKSLNIKGNSEAAKVATISNFLRQDFQYSLDLAPASPSKTPLAAFLLDHRSGHCEYFASATALLLRSAGIPSRYVVGYSVSEYNPTEQAYIVRLRDAHAWVMAYVNNRWITIDTTPSNGASQNRNGQATVEELVAQQTPANRVNPRTELSTATPSSNRQLQAQANDPSGAGNDRPAQSGAPDSRAPQGQAEIQNSGSRASDLQEPSVAETWLDAVEDQRQSLASVWARVKEQFEQFSESIGLPGAIALGMATGTGILIWRLYRRPQQRRRRWRKRKPRLKSSASPLTEDRMLTFRHLEEKLQAWNLQRGPTETPKQWVTRLKDELSSSKFQGLQEILDLHYRDRFDPTGLDQSDRQQLSSLIETWLTDFDPRTST